MTPDTLARLTALDAQATKAEDNFRHADKPGAPATQAWNVAFNANEDAQQALIAAMRNALPDILSDLETLRQVRELRERIVKLALEEAMKRRDKYCGPSSVPFWRRVRATGDMVLYGMACALQERERRVLTRLEKTETRRAISVRKA